MPSPGPTHSAAIADLLYYSCFQVGGKLNKAFGCNMTDEAIFKVANSRLGLYRRCGMDVVNYLLSPKVLSLPKKENQPGLVDSLTYYLKKT